MEEMASDKLPERWQGLKDAKTIPEASGPPLQEWLEQMYYDSVRKNDMTKEDIRILGGLIAKLLHFEPSKRASAKEVLSDPWFNNCQ